MLDYVYTCTCVSLYTRYNVEYLESGRLTCNTKMSDSTIELQVTVHVSETRLSTNVAYCLSLEHSHLECTARRIRHTQYRHTP